MTATAHALIAGAIISYIPNPSISLPLVAISHPLADMIPHWDFGSGWREKTKIKLFMQGSLDLIAGTILSYLIFGQNLNPLYFLYAIFLSEVWDMMQVPYWLLNWNFPPFSYFYQIQHEIGRSADLPWGIVTQVASVLAVMYTLRVVAR